MARLARAWPAVAVQGTVTTCGEKSGSDVLSNYLFLPTAQRTYFQTNLIYLDALRELRTAATAIEGNLLSGSLQVSDTSDHDRTQ